MVNFKVIIRTWGSLLIIESVFLLISSLVSLSYGESDFIYFLLSTAISATVGGVAIWQGRGAGKQFGKREGYIIVAMVWVVFSFFGMMPYWLSGAIPGFTDAFFETMSGFTTTGSSILNNIESMTHGVLFWRSITQWLGGMGMIVLSLAVLPFLGVGGMALFEAEVPGLTYDKLQPRITDTARQLWLIYLVLTLVQSLLLFVGGMDYFDAICHSFTTMATGGYSTKQASIAHWDSAYIQYVITFFMFLGGVNFTLLYGLSRGKFLRLKGNDEFRFYWVTVLGVSVLIGGVLWMMNTYTGAEKAFRDALFQVVSIVTTTGFATVDYMIWAPFMVAIVFLLMFFGGCAGSTAGGIKIARINLLIKNSGFEMRRLIHPNAVISVRSNGKVVPQSVLYNVLAFVVVYLMIVGLSTIAFSALGYDLPTSLGAVATSIGNIGPGLNELGPAFSFSQVPAVGKWFLALLMLVGRLELFTVILLFSPGFWRH